MVEMACLPNASAIVQHWRGCPNGDWAVHAAADPAIVARWPKPVLVNLDKNPAAAALPTKLELNATNQHS